MKKIFDYTRATKFRFYIPIIILSIFLCVNFLNFIYYSLYRIPFPYEIEQEEGFCIERASWILDGHWPYKRLDTYPFVRNPYVPLYHFFCVPFLMMLGKKIIAGRLVSLMFSLLSGFFIYKIVSKRSKTNSNIPGKNRWGWESALPGLIAAGLFFSYDVIRNYSTIAKPDIAANFFSIFALYIISKSENNKYLIFTAFISFIAVFTKQQAIPAIIAIFLYLLTEDHKKGLRFFLAFMFFTSIAVIITQIVTDYNFLYQVDPSYGMGFYILDRLKGFMLEYISVNYIPLLLAMLSTFLISGNAVYKLFFLCCIPFLISLGMSGAIANHFISFFTAMCILVGLLLAGSERFYRNLIATFLIFFLLFPNNSFSQFDFKHHPNGWINPWVNREIYDKIVSYIRQAPGDVLTEHASFAFLSKKKVLVLPIALSPSYASRQTDTSQLLADCQARRFSYIIYKLFIPLVFGDLLYQNYYVSEILSESGGGYNWFILKPRITYPAEITENAVYLSDLPAISVKQGWGTLGLDKNAGGEKLTTGGGLYSKGLGTHANSEIVYNVEGYKEFRATIGVDGKYSGVYPDSYSSVIFKIYLDNEPAFESAIFYQRTPPQKIDIPLNGAKILKLVVTDAKKGDPSGFLIACDWANWADAKLIK